METGDAQVYACGPKACHVTNCFFVLIGGWLWGRSSATLDSKAALE